MSAALEHGQRRAVEALQRINRKALIIGPGCGMTIFADTPDCT
jgi:hypothetical protein